MENLQNCIEACQRCADACLACANACLQEQKLAPLRDCIRLDLECEAMCRTTAQLLVSGSAIALKITVLCAEICEACALECENHAKMEHCAKCAEACKMCAMECRMMH